MTSWAVGTRCWGGNGGGVASYEKRDRGNRGGRHLLGDGQAYMLLKCYRPSAMRGQRNNQSYMGKFTAAEDCVKLRRYMYHNQSLGEPFDRNPPPRQRSRDGAPSSEIL